MNTQTDEQLIERLKNDEEIAFTELVTRYSSKAYMIAYGVLGNVHDSEEVVQDAFLRAYRGLAKFRGDSKFSTWLYRIVVNLARNKFQWNKRRKIGSNLSIDASKAEENENIIQIPDSKNLEPDKQIVSKEEKNKILECLDLLPLHYKEVLVLRHVEDMSYEGIAKMLDCKLGTVKSRISRAREELKNMICKDN